jgi:HEAT repeat protein
VFALAVTAANDLLFFEFGDFLDPNLTVEEKVNWILEDYEQRKGDFFTISVSQSVALLAKMLGEAGDDPARMLPPIRGLGFLRSANGAPPLRRGLSHPSVEVRRETIVSLGRIGAFESFPWVEPFLNDPDRELRRAAIVMLGRSLDPAIFPRLERAAGSDPELQELVRQGRRRFDAVQAQDMDALAEAVLESEEYEDLIRLLEVTWKRVLRIIRDRNRELVIRLRAVRVVGLVGMIRAATSIAPIVGDASEPRDLRLAAVIAAGRCKADAALNGLINLLDSPDVELQSGSVNALGLIGSPAALDPLIEKWLQLPRSVRPSIRLALRRLCKMPGAAQLVALLRQDRPWNPQSVYFITDDLHLTLEYREGILDGELAIPNAEARRDAILLMAYLGDETEVAKLQALGMSEVDSMNREIAALAVSRMQKKDDQNGEDEDNGNGEDGEE